MGHWLAIGPFLLLLHIKCILLQKVDWVNKIIVAAISEFINLRFRMWELLQTLSSILHLSLLFPSWNEETFLVQREMQVWWKLGDRGLAVAAFRPETAAAFWPLIGRAAIMPASHWPRQTRGFNSDSHLRWQFQLLSINRRHIFCSTSSVSVRL